MVSKFKKVRTKFLLKMRRKLMQRKMPFHNEISVYKFFKIFFSGISKGAFDVRASSASWHLFMSVFPFTIFLLLLIKYLPYSDKLQELIYQVILNRVLPSNLFESGEQYIKERSVLVFSNFEKSNIILLILSVLLFVFLSAKGIRALIIGFRSINNDRSMKQKGVQSFKIPLLLTLFYAFFIVLSLIVTYINQIVFRYFNTSFSFNVQNLKQFLGITNFVLSLIITFFGICFLYYFGRTTQLSFKEVMPGAAMTTILFTLISSIFVYYIKHFTRFNALYGSIGSILIVMIWININVTFVLLGYELNVALKKARNFVE